MAKEKINKIVGYISDDIIQKYHLEEYRDRPIVQSLDLYVHIKTYKRF